MAKISALIATYWRARTSRLKTRTQHRRQTFRDKCSARIRSQSKARIRQTRAVAEFLTA
jgi:hypothetical protein